jgi:hypothetical protein
MHTWIVDTTGATPSAVWHTSRVLWFLAAYVALFAYFKHWLAPLAAFGAVCGVAATLPLTYTNSWAHPDAIPELALFTLGCLAIVRSWNLGLAAVLAVAALNRETAAFLVPAYLLVPPRGLERLAKGVGFGLLFAAIFTTLRVWRGFEHYDYWQLGRNVTFLGLLPASYDIYKRAYAWFIVVLATPAAVMVVARWRHVPPDARGLAIASLPFLATALTLSSIIETRIFIPLYPLIMPALMCTLLQSDIRSGGIRS